jgi:DNA invertase Pin-like site-specific DNA recombinase
VFARVSRSRILSDEDYQNGSFLMEPDGAARPARFDIFRNAMTCSDREIPSRPRARRIGYARVSTDDQNLALQLDALKAARCDLIFHDEGISGISVTRPALSEVLAALAPGDVLIVWKLDRLGRSLAHLIAVIAGLAERGVGFRSLSESIDTTTAGGRLIFHVMGALAEFERALIAERTRAGMEAARARGALIGRPRKLSDSQLLIAKEQLDLGRGTLGELASAFGVTPLTLSRALKRLDRAA